MKTCAKCILTESFPNIKFDSNGVCNYCNDWDKKWLHYDYEKAEMELIDNFNNAKKKNRKYDCLVPFSGGRDSSYVLYLCKEKYKLNPLAVTFNNTFMSKYSVDNIFNIVKKLNVDHVMFTYKPNLLNRFYKSMIKDGGEFCSICTSGINLAIIRYQKIYKIPLVIMGTSTRVDEQSPFEVTSTHPLYVRKVLLKNGFSNEEISDFLVKRQYELSAFEKIKLKITDSDFCNINLPDYVRWSNDEIQDFLCNKLGWETPDLAADHIDCKFASIKYFLKNKQIPNFIFKQEKYSQLIRDGQLTREDAIVSLKKLIRTEFSEPKEMADFLSFFKLNISDVENRDKISHLNYICKDDLKVEEGILFKMLSVPWKIYKKIRDI